MFKFTTANPNKSSILLNLIHNGFGPIEVLYEMSYTKIFSYIFSPNKSRHLN